MMIRSANRVRFSSSAVRVVFDGNSLVYGTGATVSLPTQLASLRPLSGTGISVAYLGVPGQDALQMNGLMGGSSADVDAAWVAGKLNVLFVWEGTNSVFNSLLTGARAVSDMSDYIAGRLAVHPWHVILLTTLPRQKSGITEAQQISMNGDLDYYNAYIKASYRDMGVAQVVDVRQPGGPFTTASYTNAAMETLGTNGYWAAGETGQHTHLNNAGYGVIAGLCADALKRIRSR